MFFFLIIAFIVKFVCELINPFDQTNKAYEIPSYMHELENTHGCVKNLTKCTLSSFFSLLGGNNRLLQNFALGSLKCKLF